jgi:hypothetical protein
MAYMCNNCCIELKDDFVIYGSQFTSSNEYKNPFLKGRFRLKMRGFESLAYKTEWDYLEEGGFKILIPTFQITPETIIIGEFY